MNKNTSLLFLSILSGIIGGSVSTFGILQWKAHDTESLIAEFYATESAVHVSPHGLRKKMDERKTDYTLVDLRSRQEYEKEHIAGAVSIPAYSDPDTSAYGDVERIVGAFTLLPQDKPIIVYCYSMPCMTGRKIGKMLTEHGIYVQHLGIGWNEWRHFWNLWNHEHEWGTTKVEEYVVSGSEPGEPTGTPSISPCVEGQFGC